MKRRVFLKRSALTLGSFAAGHIADKAVFANSNSEKVVIMNPYQNVDWSTTRQHKAALHLHTLQSDGFQKVDEVVRAYKDAGYSIIAVTDHDWNEPNRRIVNNWGPLPAEKATPYPKEPKPDNYPANPTWPWTDYGALKPTELGVVGIQGNELTYKHHINSYYNDYGIWHGTHRDLGGSAPYRITDDDGHEIVEDDQIEAINAKGGLAILCHPSISCGSVEPRRSWWQRKSLQWYIGRFQKHASDCLIGMEVTNHHIKGKEDYDEGLWDQLLARFMPDRPIWGFGNDDMHNLERAKETYNVFFLDKLSDSSVRKAMETGQFVFFKTTGTLDGEMINYRKDSPAFTKCPKITEIKVDEDSSTITVNATNYSEIRWISAPKSLDPLADYRTSHSPWPLGQVVHTGKTIDIKAVRSRLRNYVRAEIVRQEGRYEHKICTNPFGIA